MLFMKNVLHKININHRTLIIIEIYLSLEIDIINLHFYI